MRWLACLAIVGCYETSSGPPDGPPPGGDCGQDCFTQNFPLGAPAIDILFVVDDSSSMTTTQYNFAAGFPVFINILTSLPVRPDMHIALTTTSMGAGAFTATLPGCMEPQLGNFVTTARAATDPSCTTNRLNDNEHFFIDSSDGSVKNYTGDLALAIGCLVQVGANGCGFEQPLAAARAALGDPMMNLPAPAGNASFMRDDALLAVVFVTNEDDCSVPPDSQLFDPSQTSIGPLGPLASFRCTEFGILCDGQRPPRQAAGPLANCTSNDALASTDPQHSLVPMQFYIDYFRRLKPVANRVVTAVIGAPANPFSVVLDPQTQYPMLAHSCMSSNGTFGDPAVRLTQLTDAFPSLGIFESLCQNSYADIFGTITNAIGRTATAQCVTGVIGDPTQGYSVPTPTPAPGLVLDPARYSCSVDDVQHNGIHAVITLDTLQPCNPAGQSRGQCFALLGNASCSSGIGLAVCRNGFNPANPMMPCPDGPNAAPAADTVVLRCRTAP